MIKQVMVFESSCPNWLSSQINGWLGKNFIHINRIVAWHVSSSAHSQSSHGGAGVRDCSICVVIEYEIDPSIVSPSLNGQGGVHEHEHVSTAQNRG